MVRKWFGATDVTQRTNDANKALDELLELYKQALMRYFDIQEADNAEDVIDQSSTKELLLGKRLFLDWLKEQGLMRINQLAAKDLEEDSEMQAIIQYEHYILSEEMDFQYPDDVRSCLISIPIHLNEQLTP